MKLQLKHLDFVNNGKVRFTGNLSKYNRDFVNLQDCQLSFNEAKEPYLIYEKIYYYLYNVKPYKRSLSQLTQEIEVDGVRFVPLVELAKIQYSELEWSIEDNSCLARLNIGVLLEFTIDEEIPFYKEYHNNMFGQRKREGYDDMFLADIKPSAVREKLKEWHFAIDIPSELYIEIEAIPTTKPNTA
jgi:hypothetical protein